MPARTALHDTVAVPDPVTLGGLIAPQTSPRGTVSVRETTPLKWLVAVMVMFEIVDVPTLTGAGEEAVVLKSQNWKSVVVVWTNEPLVPVRVSV